MTGSFARFRRRNATASAALAALLLAAAPTPAWPEATTPTLCSSAAGPCVYVGSAMKPVRGGLGVSNEDWATFLGIIEVTLEDLAVAPSERKDVLGLLNKRFRPDAVDRP